MTFQRESLTAREHLALANLAVKRRKALQAAGCPEGYLADGERLASMIFQVLEETDDDEVEMVFGDGDWTAGLAVLAASVVLQDRVIQELVERDQ